MLEEFNRSSGNSRKKTYLASEFPVNCFYFHKCCRKSEQHKNRTFMLCTVPIYIAYLPAYGLYPSIPSLSNICCCLWSFTDLCSVNHQSFLQNLLGESYMLALSDSDMASAMPVCPSSFSDELEQKYSSYWKIKTKTQNTEQVKRHQEEEKQEQLFGFVTLNQNWESKKPSILNYRVEGVENMRHLCLVFFALLMKDP